MSSARQPMQRRHWLRFGLRSLLVVLTVACVWLAIVFNQCRRQRRAIEAIEQADGKVDYQHQYAFRQPADNPIPWSEIPAPGPAWLRQLTGDDLFLAPDIVEIRGEQFDDEFLAEHLAGVRRAHWLIIDSTQATDRGLASLPQFSDLEWLDLSTPLITDTTMARIGRLKRAESVRLHCPLVTDEGLNQLANLPELFELDITSPRISAAGIRQLKRLKHMQIVKMVRDPRNDKLVEELWNRPGYVEFVETPLHEILDQIVADYHVSIDRRLIPDEARRAIISLKCDDPLGVALEQLLQPFDMGFYLDGGTVRIVPAAEAMARRSGYVAIQETFPKADLIMVDW